MALFARRLGILLLLVSLLLPAPAMQARAHPLAPSVDLPRANPGDVVINEVDADTPSTDDHEFIELYDGGDGNTPLDGLVVVFYNGNGDVSYNALDLDAYSTDANGYLIIGNALVGGVDLVIPNNSLQNGADAVALYTGDDTDFGNGTPVTTTNLIDALVYDTSDPDDPGLLILLNPGQPQVNENGGGSSPEHSNQRCPNGSGGQRNTDSYIQQVPTPDGPNDCPLPDLTLSKVDEPDPVEAGALLTYTLTIANQGQSVATGLVITDQVPLSTTFAWANNGGVLMGDVVYWDNGISVTQGNSVEVTFAVTVDAGLPDLTIIYNNYYGVTCTEAITVFWGSPVTTTVAGCLPPTADFDSDSPVLLGDSMHFVATVVGSPPFSYTWDFGDGVGSSTQPNPVYTYTISGTFIVYLGVENDCGSDVISHPVEILAASAVHINEIRIDQPSTDDDEYLELAGPAGSPLLGLSYIVLGDSTSGGSGVVEAIVQLSGTSIPADGLFLAAEDNDTFGAPADLIASLNFENSDNVTHMLVQNFSGSSGQDLDIDDDGVLDIIPWTSLEDCVALLHTEGGGDLVYCPTTVGPDGSTVLSHVYKCPMGDWMIGASDPVGGRDTPGTANPCSSDVTIGKTGPDLATPASAISYTVRYANIGADFAHDVVISDTLPNGLHYLADDSGLDCPACVPFATGTLTWSVGTIDVPNVYSFTLVVWITDGVPSGSVLTNTVEIATTDAELTTSNNLAQVTTTVHAPSPDLAVSKIGPTSVYPGEAITYTLTIENLGQRSALDVRLTDTLPAAVALISSSPPFSQTAGDTVVWELGALDTGTLETVLLVGQVLSSAVGTLTNTAVASTVYTETTLDNNTSTWTTTVRVSGEGHVVINEIAWGGTAASATDEWIELYNASSHLVDLAGWTLSDGDAFTITLSDLIPAGGYYLLERGDDNTVRDIPADWVGSLGSGLSNGGEVLTLSNALAQVVDTANGDGGEWPAGTASPNYQSMERINPLSSGDDNWVSNDRIHRNGEDANGDPINGTPKALNSALVAPDLSVAKTGPLTVSPGMHLSYTLVVSNVGVLPAEGLRISDTLPYYVEFVSQTSSYPLAFTQTASRQLLWTAETLPTGTVAVITLSAWVGDSAVGGVTNLLHATTATSETVLDNNTARWTTDIVGGAYRVALPLLYKNYWHDVKIYAVLYDGYQYLDRDEAVRLINLGTGTADLGGWELCKYTSQGVLSCRRLPPAALPAGESMWLTRNAISFTLSFGFSPDYELDEWLSSGLANDGDEVILRNVRGDVVDVLIYGDSPYSTTTGWSGPALDPYYSSPGQVLHRILDEATVWPIPDTDSAADWWQHDGDPYSGRRALYAGWDMEAFYRPLVVTEEAALTVAIAPDHAAEVLLQAIATAQSTIEAELYELKHYGIVLALVDKAQQGVSVTVLLEGGPAGGLSDQERWACQQLDAVGGQCWFMFNWTHSAEHVYIHDRYDYLHSKMMLIDRESVVISSQNPTAGGMPDDDKSDGTWGSRGVLLVTDAPSVVARSVAIFEADFDPAQHNDLTRWAADNPYGFGLPEAGFEPSTDSGGISSTVYFPTPLVIQGDMGFELFSSPEASLRQSDALFGLLAQAGHGDIVDIEQMYEHRNWGKLADGTPAPNLRLEAYIDAARRGAQLRILLNAGSFGQDFIDLAKNIETLAYVNALAISENLDLQARLIDPTDYGVHNKMVLLRLGGQGYAHIGSINGSETSSKKNRELAVQVRSDPVYDYLNAMFERDWSQAAPLVVSEVLYDPSGAEPGAEWFEIYNPAPQAVDLSGWSVGDALVWGEWGSGRYTFPDGAAIAAHDFVLVAAQAAHFEAVYGFLPDYEFNINPVWDDPSVPNMPPMGAWEGFGFALGNSGDELGLWNAADEVVDVLVYCNGSFPTCGGEYSGVQPFWDYIDADHSLERRPPDLDTDDCGTDFYDTELPTPGDWPEGYVVGR